MIAERDDRVPTQYFADDPAAPSRPATVDVVLEDVAFEFVTDRGVFSHGRLDTGTSLLLRRGPSLPPSGRLLDLGCGAGPIALTMALRRPEATVWAVDVNRRARELCAGNATRNGLTNVEVCAPDDVPADLRFDAIWSNPPIRIGKSSLHHLLLEWLIRVDPGGSVALVVQKHLGADSLQRWLATQGYAFDRIAAASGYRVLAATFA